MQAADEVLDFWLGEVGEAGWFAGGEALDARCRERFAGLWAEARAGRLDGWTDAGARATLAFVILTDQLPRNIFRGQAEAFATDAQARAAARQALARGQDMEVAEPERLFLYLPFEHSEDAADQALAVRLMSERVPSRPELALHARAHAEVIARFGRFPFRNAALGRESTPQERAFLEAGGYAAVVRALSA